MFLLLFPKVREDAVLAEELVYIVGEVGSAK